MAEAKFSRLSIFATRKSAKPTPGNASKPVPNATRLMIGDDDELEMSGMQVNVQVDGFRARVLIDCFFYNDRDQQLEGNFKLRLPDDASLVLFCVSAKAPTNTNLTSDWVKNEFQDDRNRIRFAAAGQHSPATRRRLEKLQRSPHGSPREGRVRLQPDDASEN